MSATMEPRIQYAKTSDGVNIAYAEFGEGRPLIVVGSPGLCHAALSCKVFEYFYRPLAASFRVVDYDSRGAGLSDRDAIDFSMEAMISDLEAVVAQNWLDSIRVGGSDQRRPDCGDLRSGASGARLPPGPLRWLD